MRKQLTAIQALDAIIAVMKCAQLAHREARAAIAACPDIRRTLSGSGWLLNDNPDTIIARAAALRNMLTREDNEIAA
jgi:hypothetical protein